MATKKGGTRQADDAVAQNRAAQERNARTANEQKASASQQAAKQAAADNTPKEGDYVTLDVNGVPPTLHTAHMVNSLRNLNAAGMHGRSGRVERFVDGPGGREAVVQGADFTQQVPVAMLKRSDVFQQGQKKSARKGARKSSAKKSTGGPKKAAPRKRSR